MVDRPINFRDGQKSTQAGSMRIDIQRKSSLKSFSGVSVLTGLWTMDYILEKLDPLLQKTGPF